MTVAAHPIDLQKMHTCQDIWVIAAGASMNFVNPSFLKENNRRSTGSADLLTVDT